MALLFDEVRRWALACPRPIEEWFELLADDAV